MPKITIGGGDRSSLEGMNYFIYSSFIKELRSLVGVYEVYNYLCLGEGVQGFRFCASAGWFFFYSNRSSLLEFVMR